MKKYKVSAVSYTNSKPFVYGLEHSPILQQIELKLDNPSVCAEKLLTGQADIGLVPAATLLTLSPYYIVSPYGIGATSAVNSVFILSELPLNEINDIELDPQSRTSNLLAQIVVNKFSGLRCNFVRHSKEAKARVLIGDRTFEAKQHYPYVYDLSQLWYNETQLPFVFAVWVTNQPIDNDFKHLFSEALKHGIDCIDKVIEQEQTTLNSDFDLKDYYYHKIDFHLTAAHQQGMQLFLKYAQEFL